MTAQRYRFLGYEESRRVPNLVIDGAPNESTVLTLTHWPGRPQPAGTDVDTSAEMAFAFLDDPIDHEPATAVTNNHFDQDGAVGILALVQPDEALAHRELLVDLARAGDFGTYRFRDAARASMVLNAYADPDRSPIADRLIGDHDADTATLYEILVPELPALVTDPSTHRALWADEDERLTASEEALATGRARISEDAELDLAVVEVDEAEPDRPGHRFGHLNLGPIHPMAVHNATTCSRLLLVHGPRFRYVDRYETWVQLHARRPPRRVDLRPLAEALTEADRGATWQASRPSALTPMLEHDGRSSIDQADVEAAVRRHLRTARTAWDPYQHS